MRIRKQKSFAQGRSEEVFDLISIGLNLKTEYMGKKNYEYLNMIGKGGFGKVWRVKHVITGNIYALK
jgi:serine/threonine protein kinase